MVHQHETLQRSVEGFEARLAGNYIGTFLLASLILPRLRQSGPGARIVIVSSLTHTFEPFRWDDPNYELRPYEYSMSAHSVLFLKSMHTNSALQMVIARMAILSLPAHFLPRE